MISVLILTLNEEQNFPAALESVKWSDDVVVLDSFSTDRTMEIAKAGGARAFQRKFDDFAAQRNYALDHISFKNPWVFHLDADERFTEALRVECEAAVAKNEFSGFLVPSKTMFMGRWLRWAGMYPSYQMRLMKVGEIKFVQKGHGQREAQSARGVGMLREPYLHYNFSKGLDDWLEKHNRYSAKEAEESLREIRNGGMKWRGLFAFGEPIHLRRALKTLSSRLPCRPTLRFLYMYFVRMGFLDGYPGLTYCRLLALYEYLIALKMRETKLREKGLTL